MRAYTTKELVERRHWRKQRQDDDTIAVLEDLLMRLYPPIPVGATLHIPRFSLPRVTPDAPQ